MLEVRAGHLRRQRTNVFEAMLPSLRSDVISSTEVGEVEEAKTRQ